jgi:hypothetical protein
MDWNKIYIYDSNGTLLKIKTNNQHTKVGWINSSGYIQVEYKQKAYMLHRIIYEMHHGKIPNGFVIDHIDRNPLNNKIENLRLASLSENKINSAANHNNTTGFKGVIRTPNNKFQARLGFNNKKLYLGLFNTKEEAAAAIKKKSIELYGEFTV